MFFKFSLSSRAGRIIHGIMMCFWLAQMVAVAVIMRPLDWKVYLLELSLYANFVGHWSGHSAERPTQIED